MPEVSAKAGAHVAHEMIAAGVTGATKESVAVQEPVEAKVFGTDSTQHLTAKALGDMRNPDAIDRPEDRTVGLVSAVQTLARLPEQIAFNAEAMMYQQISRETGI